MFTTIVVGIDGAPGGEDALALARALAGGGTRLVLVNAFPSEKHAPRGSGAGFQELLHKQSLEILNAAAGDPAAVLRAVADASPGRALHTVADEEHADLIVVGSCHHGTVTRVLLGDVSRSVLHGAPCPVAVAPRDWREHPRKIAAIGVGYEDSPEAQAALAFARDLAESTGAALRLRTSVAPPAAFVPTHAYTFDWVAVEEERRAVAQEHLQSVAAGLGVPVSTETTGGTPAGDLTALSERVDLLVVGSRGWGTARRVVLGSTSDRLAHHARCPVLVVPSTAHDRASERKETVPA